MVNNEVLLYNTIYFKHALNNFSSHAISISEKKNIYTGLNALYNIQYEYFVSLRHFSLALLILGIHFMKLTCSFQEDFPKNIGLYGQVRYLLHQRPQGYTKRNNSKY